jgi:hypothetical protein
MLKAKEGRRKVRRGKSLVRRPVENAAVPHPDLGDIMALFNEALSLLVVCERSLAEIVDAVHEEQVIGAAIAKFRNVYEEIDSADLLIRRAAAEKKAR